MGLCFANNMPLKYKNFEGEIDEATRLKDLTYHSQK